MQILGFITSGIKCRNSAFFFGCFLHLTDKTYSISALDFCKGLFGLVWFTSLEFIELYLPSLITSIFSVIIISFLIFLLNFLKIIFLFAKLHLFNIKNLKKITYFWIIIMRLISFIFNQCSTLKNFVEKY